MAGSTLAASISEQDRFRPVDPICRFGPRLLFVTLPSPLPSPVSVNAHFEHKSRIPLEPAFEPDPYNATYSVSDQLRDHQTGSSQGYHFWSVDEELPYLAFAYDTGPLNCAHLYRFCIALHDLLKDAKLLKKQIVLYSSSEPSFKLNAATLLCLYLLIVNHRSPADSFYPVSALQFLTFRDAGKGRSDFNLSIQDCLHGMSKAVEEHLLRMDQFDCMSYEHYEKVENGDFNWITPGFIAFASPTDPVYVRSNLASSSLVAGRKLPQAYQQVLEFFSTNQVKLVVRLNDPLYDAKTFEAKGIKHQEMYFDDGTNPTDEIVREFIRLSDEIISTGGVVAVHCKAGLGRTGTLIGAYLIYKHGFTAHEAIAFMRIMRPGSVVGPQQQYIYAKQVEWIRWAVVDRLQRSRSTISETEEIPSQSNLSIPSSSATISRPRTPSLSNVAACITPPRYVSAYIATPAKTPIVGQPRKTPVRRTTSEGSLTADLRSKPPTLSFNSPAKDARPQVSPAKGRPKFRPQTATILDNSPENLAVNMQDQVRKQEDAEIPRYNLRLPASPEKASRLPTLVPTKRAHSNPLIPNDSLTCLPLKSKLVKDNKRASNEKTVKRRQNEVVDEQ